jgi:hypothetical protein
MWPNDTVQLTKQAVCVLHDSDVFFWCVYTLKKMTVSVATVFDCLRVRNVKRVQSPGRSFNLKNANSRHKVSAPEGSAPEGSVPEGSVPAPDGSAPEDSVHEGSAPEGSAPEGSAPEGSVSKSTMTTFFDYLSMRNSSVRQLITRSIGPADVHVVSNDMVDTQTGPTSVECIVDESPRQTEFKGCECTSIVDEILGHRAQHVNSDRELTVVRLHCTPGLTDSQFKLWCDNIRHAYTNKLQPMFPGAVVLNDLGHWGEFTMEQCIDRCGVSVIYRNGRSVVIIQNKNVVVQDLCETVFRGECESPTHDTQTSLWAAYCMTKTAIRAAWLALLARLTYNVQTSFVQPPKVRTLHVQIPVDTTDYNMLLHEILCILHCGKQGPLRCLVSVGHADPARNVVVPINHGPGFTLHDTKECLRESQYWSVRSNKWFRLASMISGNHDCNMLAQSFQMYADCVIHMRDIMDAATSVTSCLVGMDTGTMRSVLHPSYIASSSVNAVACIVNGVAYVTLQISDPGFDVDRALTKNGVTELRVPEYA